ncbi:MAG TPA: hypothetical protein DHV48_03335 [Prolixibacteraceae bacterium]|nr:hypothetical protein [Prolixibacteraceae bacterium]
MTEIEKYEQKPALPATTKSFLAEFAPAQCLRVFQKVNTPALAITSMAPTLGNIRREYSEDFLVAYVSVWIVNLNDFVNALRKMLPQQIEETAILIVQEYPYLNLADINLVFRKIKKGEFGQLFAEIDGMKVLSWFEQYAQERARTAADFSMSQSEQFKQDLPRTSDAVAINKIKNRQAIGLHIQQQAKHQR